MRSKIVYFGGILDPIFWSGFSCLWDQGIRGAILGSNLDILCPNQLSPVRARAYNDLSKDAILLKTRSSGGSGVPPLLNVFSDPTDGA